MNPVTLFETVADNPFDFTPVITAITSNITPLTVITLIGVVVGATFTIHFAWVGGRKVLSAILSAVSGKGVHI